MSDLSGFVNKIIPCSFVDGPGSRFVVFLQGCNMHCATCHNPQTRGHCKSCGSFILLEEPRPKGECYHCFGKTTLAGPLWLGGIQETPVIEKAFGWEGLSRRAKKLLDTCASEAEVPMYYDHHSICERLRITPGKIDDAIERLRESGHRASRTHFLGLGIKTDAAMAKVEAAIRPA